MFQMNLSPVSGHPYVSAWDGQAAYGHQIRCQCAYCGDNWSRDCNYQDKAKVWVAMYCAKHCHGNEQCSQIWETAYHTSLQAFNMKHRGW